MIYAVTLCLIFATLSLIDIMRDEKKLAIASIEEEIIRLSIAALRDEYGEPLDPWKQQILELENKILEYQSVA